MGEEQLLGDRDVGILPIQDLQSTRARRLLINDTRQERRRLAAVSTHTPVLAIGAVAEIVVAEPCMQLTRSA